jgi:hypothetical protein
LRDLPTVYRRKERSKERGQCATEAANLYSLLIALKYRLEEAEAQSSQPWLNSVKVLGVQGGPLDQYHHCLQEIQLKLGGTTGSKLGRSLRWTLTKSDVNILLLRIERLKNVISIAMEMDHFKFSQAVHSEIEYLHGEATLIKTDAQIIRTDTQTIRDTLPSLEAGVRNLLHSHEREWPVQEDERQSQRRERQAQAGERWDQEGERQAGKRDSILAWISHLDFAVQHADFTPESKT